MTMCKNINAFLHIFQYESMNQFHDISALMSAKRIAPVYNCILQQRTLINERSRFVSAIFFVP